MHAGRRRHGRADSGISIGATPAVGAAAVAAEAGAAAAGAAAAGVAAEVAAGKRPANGVPGASGKRGRWATMTAGSAVRRLPRPERSAGAAGTAGVCGSVSDAVAPGAAAAGAAAAGAAAGAAACALPSSDVKPCMSVVAAAGLVASCWRNGRPGTPGVGRAPRFGCGRRAEPQCEPKSHPRQRSRWWQTFFW